MSSTSATPQVEGEGARNAPKPAPDITTHYLRYSVSNGAVMLLGFISFPILTRLLDNTQFGILKYYDTLMLLGVALVKFGAPHAIVRFYPYEGDVQATRGFGINMVLLPLLLSLAIWAAASVVIVLIQWAVQGPTHPLLWFALAVIPLLAATNIVQMVIRASERSDILMATRIIARLLELVFVLGAVVLIQKSALSVYGGKIVAAALVLAWLMIWLRRNVTISRDALDLKQFGAGLVYGVPLMANELAASLLANVDRVLIRHMTGDFSMVGIYAIGYALAMQLNVFINATLSEAFTPAVMRSYENGGNEAVQALKDRVLRPMTYAVTAIIAMLLVSGRDLLVALSGPDKAASGDVFIIVGITISLFALFSISNYGLQLKKQTVHVLAITAGAVLLNLAANFVLIPRMGYIGAAWATAISYAGLCIAQFAICPEGLARLPGLRTVVVGCSCGAALVIVAHAFDMFGVEGAWSRLLVAGVLFLALYAAPVLLLDGRFREMVRGLARRVLP